MRICGRAEQEGAEKREAFRCPVSAAGQEAVFQVGDAEIPVQLLDESAGGFALWADRDPGVEVDEVARLHTESGSHEVRVAHVQSEQQTSEMGQGTEGDPPGFRLGLERLRELEARGIMLPRMSWLDRVRVAGFCPLGTGNVAVGIVLALAITIGLVAIAVFLWRSDGTFIMPAGKLAKASPRSTIAESKSERDRHTESERDRRASRPNFPEQDTTSERPATEPDWRWQRASTSDHSTRGSPRPSGGPRSAAADSEGCGDAPWRTMIRRLPGAAVFLVEEVVQELNLTQEQVDELERIVELVGEAIQQIPIRWSHESRQQHAEKRQIVLAEARRRALEVLTEEQRACWETLQAEAAGEPGDAK